MCEFCECLEKDFDDEDVLLGENLKAVPPWKFNIVKSKEDEKYYLRHDSCVRNIAVLVSIRFCPACGRKLND